MTTPTEGESRRWRITLLTTFPKSLLSDMSGGFPEKLEFGTRIEKSMTDINGVSVRLAPAEGEFPELAHLHMQDPATLIIELDAPTSSEALESATTSIDLVVDDLSFQLQEPLQMYSMRVLDVTPPLHVGDEREFMQYNGYDQYKLSRSTPMGTTQTALVPTLRSDYAALSRRTQDALDWYIKSMHTPWDADQYIFLWICFEILRNSNGPKIEEPARLRCQHEIVACPKCGKLTAQVRQAASTYEYLAAFGVEQQLAKDLWGMRQLVHGSKSFKRDQLERLGELLQVLRAICAAALRVAMGIPDDSPPFVGYGAAAIGVAMGMGGTTAITEADL